ncbi:SLC13 family permease [Caminibacter sp.]
MNILKREFLFFTFLALFFVLLNPSKISEYPSYIDWPTIFALFSLMIITTEIKETKYFDIYAKKLISKIHSERGMAFALVYFSVFLSMFLTNDITLFIVVPITLALKNFIKNDITKLIIFEAIAVNTGSLLTPIGNPQNIYLYHLINTSFFEYIKFMFPLFLLLFILLFVLIYFSFSNKKLEINETFQIKGCYKKLFIAIVLMIVFLILLNAHKSFYALLIVTTFYLIFNKNIFLKLDYFLIFTFILMFIDFKILGHNKTLWNLTHLFQHTHENIFIFSSLLSQIISNVPAAIFVTQFSHKYLDIAYGVNIAGNGLLISSMANVIALRFVKDSKIYLTFHKYSIPFFIISFIIFIMIQYK